MVGCIGFALERFDSPRHSSHVAQLGSLGCMSVSGDLTVNTKWAIDYETKNWSLVADSGRLAIWSAGRFSPELPVYRGGDDYHTEPRHL